MSREGVVYRGAAACRRALPPYFRSWRSLDVMRGSCCCILQNQHFAGQPLYAAVGCMSILYIKPFWSYGGVLVFSVCAAACAQGDAIRSPLCVFACMFVVSRALLVSLHGRYIACVLFHLQNTKRRFAKLLDETFNFPP